MRVARNPEQGLTLRPRDPVADAQFVADIDEMWSEMNAAPGIVQPSDLWRSLNERNVEQLNDAGFDRFKRTINQNYFAWVPSSLADDQLRSVAKDWLRHLSPLRVLATRVDDVGHLEAGEARTNPFASRRARYLHGVFLGMLWEYVHRRDSRGLLDDLDEPALGSPVVARHRGHRISQDLCNSVHELHCATSGFPDGRPGPGGVLELGGGYGRLAWAFMRAFPDVRFVVCDIPPALGIAQRYLTTLFPERRTFRFRRFGDHAEIADELAAADLVFLTPNQLEIIEPLGVSLFLNISSMHEMKPAQVAHYLAQADRHTDGFMYSKQWIAWHNPEDDVTIGRDDYPIPAHWRELRNRVHPIQRAFFHALYDTRG